MSFAEHVTLSHVLPWHPLSAVFEVVCVWWGWGVEVRIQLWAESRAVDPAAGFRSDYELPSCGYWEPTWVFCRNTLLTISSTPFSSLIYFYCVSLYMRTCMWSPQMPQECIIALELELDVAVRRAEGRRH